MKSTTPTQGARRKPQSSSGEPWNVGKSRNHVETAAEALAISLNEVGRIHWSRMEKFTGHSAKQLQRELDGLVYRNPEGDWETADRYLSGNVRAKLKTAEAAAHLLVFPRAGGLCNPIRDL